MLTSNFHEFSLILIDYIYIERELERIKVDLIKHADFNLMDCFKVFDWSRRAVLSPSDILQSLNTYFSYCDTEENWEVEINPKYENQFYLLYRRFDLNYDSVLDFSEFSKMILPINQDFAQLLISRPDFYMNRQEYEIENYFNPDTKVIIKKLFTKLLESEYQLERLRHRINALTYFNLKSAFNQMDYNFDGLIEKNDFRQFLETSGVFNPTLIDIDGLY